MHPSQYFIAIRLLIPIRILAGDRLCLQVFRCGSFFDIIDFQSVEWNNPLFRFHGPIVLLLFLNLLQHISCLSTLDGNSNGILWGLFFSIHPFGLIKILTLLTSRGGITDKIKHFTHAFRIFDFPSLLGLVISFWTYINQSSKTFSVSFYIYFFLIQTIDPNQNSCNSLFLQRFLYLSCPLNLVNLQNFSLETDSASLPSVQCVPTSTINGPFTEVVHRMKFGKFWFLQILISVSYPDFNPLL